LTTAGQSKVPRRGKGGSAKGVGSKSEREEGLVRRGGHDVQKRSRTTSLLTHDESHRVRSFASVSGAVGELRSRCKGKNWPSGLGGREDKKISWRRGKEQQERGRGRGETPKRARELWSDSNIPGPEAFGKGWGRLEQEPDQRETRAQTTLIIMPTVTKLKRGEAVMEGSLLIGEMREGKGISKNCRLSRRMGNDTTS